MFCLLLTGAHAGPFDDFSPRNKSRFEYFGDIMQFAIPLSGLIYSSVISDWQGVGQLGLSYGSTTVVTQGIKLAVESERPKAASETGSHRHDSFPSGHTSGAFSGAAYWHMRYGWEIGLPMYALAGLVGYSRTYHNKHDEADVLVGAAIGVGFALLFVSRYQPKNTHIYVAPTDGGAMLNFNTRF
jgi:membrane-associated phospholipid phosphatase